MRAYRIENAEKSACLDDITKACERAETFSEGGKIATIINRLEGRSWERATFVNGYMTRVVKRDNRGREYSIRAGDPGFEID